MAVRKKRIAEYKFRGEKTWQFYFGTESRFSAQPFIFERGKKNTAFGK
jgi:hypothetical protein